MFTGIPSASEPWSGLILLLVRLILGLAVVGAVCRTGLNRAWWLGFAAFGWISTASSYDVIVLEPRLPAQMLLDELGPKIMQAIDPRSSEEITEVLWIGVIWDGFWALLAALFGGFLVRTLWIAIAGRSDGAAASTQRAAKPFFGGLSGLPMLFLSGAVLALVVCFGGAMLPLPLWATLVFLLAWWLVGLAAARSAKSQGKLRERWLAASILAASFLLLAFGRTACQTWPTFPTVALLDELRPRMPATMRGYPPGWDPQSTVNARVYRALKRQVKMPFGDYAPLEDVLKFIGTETADESGKITPAEYVARAHGDVVMTPTVMGIDLEGVAIGTSFQLGLDQLDLVYHVRDGVLVIDNSEPDEPDLRSNGYRAYQVVGHCLLALIAGGIGAIVVPQFGDIARGRTIMPATN